MEEAQKHIAIDWRKLALSLGAPLAVGVIGALVANGEIDTWYADLSKPLFMPPNEIFGPVWTVLYLLMGIALYLVWHKPGDHREALGAFWVQLGLNLLWSFLFFGAHLLLVSLVEIMLLLLVVTLTVMQFYQVSKLAGLLLVPYLMWIMFASGLNLAIFYLN